MRGVKIRIAHVSDLHVSRYGEHVTSLRNRKLRSELAEPHEEWVEVVRVDAWRIERRMHTHWSGRDEGNGFEFRLVDEAGYVQYKKRVSQEAAGAAQESLTRMVARRQNTEHSRLAESFPTAEAIESLLSTDPHNTNLLFHRMARVLREDEPDLVLCTGDLTDDGVGYDLVLSWLAPFVDKGRLLAIPGNHDIYDSPAFFVPAHERKTRLQKRGLWAVFAAQLGLPMSGPWTREITSDLVICGLDSCLPPLTPWSASGAVQGKDLQTLRAELGRLEGRHCRIAMIHHHVVNAPLRGVGRKPWQIGMRLRNAETVFEWLAANDFRCVLNGHRHVGYRYQPAHAPMFVSAPSATLGCRSGAKPFYWRIDIEDGEIASVRERPIGP
jgi:3',5'-cyclic AMP phosphodiesterase CpdA